MQINARQNAGPGPRPRPWRPGPLAGRYPVAAAMVVLFTVPYLVLSAALRPLTPLIAGQLHMSAQAISLTSGMANAGYAVGTVLAVQLAQHLPQRRMLLARDPAGHVSLADPYGVAGLLDSLREAGAHQQVAALLARDPAGHAPLADPRGVAGLLDSLREAGAQDQATMLTNRLPAAGMFELFCAQQSRQDRFRFGQKADGSPAEPWGWDDLD
jgi:uncharacterized protein YidB (DUF937 family)